MHSCGSQDALHALPHLHGAHSPHKQRSRVRSLSQLRYLLRLLLLRMLPKMCSPLQVLFPHIEDSCKSCIRPCLLPLKPACSSSSSQLLFCALHWLADGAAAAALFAALISTLAEASAALAAARRSSGCRARCLARCGSICSSVRSLSPWIQAARCRQRRATLLDVPPACWLATCRGCIATKAGRLHVCFALGVLAALCNHCSSDRSGLGSACRLACCGGETPLLCR